MFCSNYRISRVWKGFVFFSYVGVLKVVAMNLQGYIFLNIHLTWILPKFWWFNKFLTYIYFRKPKQILCPLKYLTNVDFFYWNGYCHVLNCDFYKAQDIDFGSGKFLPSSLATKSWPSEVGVGLAHRSADVGRRPTNCLYFPAFLHHLYSRTWNRCFELEQCYLIWPFFSLYIRPKV